MQHGKNFCISFLYLISVSHFCTSFLYLISVSHFCISFLYLISVSLFCISFLYLISVSHFCISFLYLISVSHFCTSFLYFISVSHISQKAPSHLFICNVDLLYCLLVQRLWNFHSENVKSTSPSAVSIDNYCICTDRLIY
jgi:hypothetical protein